jgi:tungstate transport system substrate-binding protein
MSHLAGLCKALGLLLLVFAHTAVAHADTAFIRLATTTSTENSGLLAYLLPAFEKNHPYKVKVIAVGTGKALRLLKEGDVDAALVHARAAEDKLVAEGFGVNRHDVMYNDFVIVGPADDPAELQGTAEIQQAMQRIADSHSVFISRGDDSGTNKKELALWKQASLQPAGEWYREVGQGMGKALQITAELQGYTLTDRGTWLAYRDKLPLKIVFEGDRSLFNPYGIMAANPEKYPDANYTGAMALIKWITTAPAQHLIAQFTVNNQQLFVPMPGGINAQAQ